MKIDKKQHNFLDCTDGNVMIPFYLPKYDIWEHGGNIYNILRRMNSHDKENDADH